MDSPNESFTSSLEDSDPISSDFLEQLASDLEIPGLLGESGYIYEQNNSPDISPEMDDELYQFVNSKIDLEDTLIEPEFVNMEADGFKDEPISTPNDSSGHGSGSECSLSDTWPMKNESFSPPISPQEDRSSPPQFFIDNFAYVTVESEPQIRIKTVRQEPNNIRKKVRIQPKPSDVFISVPGSTLVCQNIWDVVPNSSNSSPSSSPEFLGSCDLVKVPTTIYSDTERQQARRKQQRMIRNRESACLSRKKKKEHVSQLESEVEQLKSENNHLKEENQKLRDRLARYEVIPPSWNKASNAFYVTTTKKKTALFALLVTVCVNIGSFSNLLGEPATEEDALSLSSVRHTRSLLWADSDVDEAVNMTQPSCPVWVNQTETIRLESELRRWIGGEEQQLRPAQGNVSKINQYFHSSEKLAGRQNRTKRKLKNRLSKVQTLMKAVDVYGPRPQNLAFDNLFQVIHRRDDTFYLVSFSADHLLLPALAHNKTSRPKMSLMLPAFLTNSSSEQVEMMQIDCEVTNTQLLSVNEHNIPLHLRHNRFNSSSRTKESSKPAATDSSNSSTSDTFHTTKDEYLLPLRQPYTGGFFSKKKPPGFH